MKKYGATTILPVVGHSPNVSEQVRRALGNKTTKRARKNLRKLESCLQGCYSPHTYKPKLYKRVVSCMKYSLEIAKRHA